ncbi:cyclase family protein [Nocardia sp. NPDC050630]|uniref:cyclase family protein n=1 Tax=Nocardia sp. NPDC050630 TaxID=3364321 RepID=UPI0037BA5775
MQLIDLSQTIEYGMTTHPGFPGPQITEYLSYDASVEHYAAGTEFAIGQITMVGNTGTYLDTPAHRFRNGKDLADLMLETCAMLPAIVVDADEGPCGPDLFSGLQLQNTAVLVRTGWDCHWGTEHYGGPAHPHLTAAGAQALVDAGARLVGIDSVNIDDTRGRHRPAHTILLGADIPVVENLTDLDRLPNTGAVFYAVPPAVRGLSTFPVRAFAFVP